MTAQVQAFFAVSTTPGMGNANGYLNNKGAIAAPRTPHVLSTDRAAAQAAADAYTAKSKKHRAEVHSTTCFPEWVGKEKH